MKATQLRVQRRRRRKRRRGRRKERERGEGRRERSTLVEAVPWKYGTMMRQFTVRVAVSSGTTGGPSSRLPWQP